MIHLPLASFTKLPIGGERENKQTNKDKRDFTIVLGPSMMYRAIACIKLSIVSQFSENLQLIVEIHTTYYDFERNMCREWTRLIMCRK